MDSSDSIIKQYRMVFDHHTHTVFSHGKGSIEDNVREAFAKGLSSVAITDHGPGHMTYGLSMAKVSDMRAEIDRLKPLYPEMRILLGVEANTMRATPYIDVDPSDRDLFDIILAGYHYGITHAGMVTNYVSAHTGLWGGAGSTLLVKNTDMIIKALYENPVDILTHPGDKGPFDIEDIAKACADTDTMIEINGKHAHLTEDEIKIAARYDVKFVIGSDAHIPSKVGEFVPQLARALRAGLDPERIVNIERI